MIKAKKTQVSVEVLREAYRLMCTAKAMTTLYEANAKVTSKYVHATSRGHEAIQIALGIQLKPQDFVAPYYRDDSILLSIGMKPHELMLQLLAKRDDPFSGGRTYYSHPSLMRDDMPKIPHQSSATGMQAIPTTGLAMLGIESMSGISKQSSIGFELFPNPATDIVYLSGLTSAVLGYEIMDVSGRIMLQSANMFPNNNMIDVSMLCNGSYIICLKTTKGIGAKRFVKS